MQLLDPLEESIAEIAQVLRPGARPVTFTHDWAIQRGAGGAVEDWLARMSRLLAAKGGRFRGTGGLGPLDRPSGPRRRLTTHHDRPPTASASTARGCTVHVGVPVAIGCYRTIGHIARTPEPWYLPTHRPISRQQQFVVPGRPQRQSYQRAHSHQGAPSLAGPPDSHPSWRPQAMWVLSASGGPPPCNPAIPQLACHHHRSGYVVSSDGRHYEWIITQMANASPAGIDHVIPTG
jgi:hypothetical protein